MSFRALRPLARAAASASHLRVAPRAAAVPAFRGAARPLSVSARRLGSGQTDGELAAALAAEHAYELDAASALAGQTPDFLETFRAAGVWVLEDVAGSDDVVVKRTFGNETLKLTFQISDLDTAEPELEGESAPAGADEDAPAPPYITCALFVAKSGAARALAVDLEAGADGFEVTNVAVYDKALAEKEGAEGDWERRSRYMGPQFDTLDATVQDGFAAFLNERGVDESLANFVVAYAEYKEQKDYVSWLAEVKEFVDA
ncbi:Mitochondrial acidic protein mam33 [Cryptotrichosporon argae]